MDIYTLHYNTLLFILMLKLFLLWLLGSPSVVPALDLESAIYPRTLGSFFVSMVLETKFWMLGALVATGVSLLVSPLS